MVRCPLANQPPEMCSLAGPLWSACRLDNIEEAIADYSRALELEPHNSTAYHNRASLFERLGRWVGRSSAKYLLEYECVCLCGTSTFEHRLCTSLKFWGKKVDMVNSRTQ